MQPVTGEADQQPAHVPANSAKLSDQESCLSAKCSLANCRMLRALGQVRTIDARSPLIWQDDAADHLFLILKGMARAFKLTADGRRQINRFAFPGDLLAVTGAGQYPYSIDAITELTVLVLPKAGTNELTQQKPCLQMLISESIVRELDEVHNQVLLLGRMNATERVQYILGLLAKHHNGSPCGAISLPVSRADMADYAGLTIETVSRTLTRLKRDGRISMPSQSEIVVPQNEAFLDAA